MAGVVRRWFCHAATILCAATLVLSAGCSDVSNGLSARDVSSMDVKVWSLKTQTFATWHASDQEIRAFLDAYNQSRPRSEDGGTTPRVGVTVHLAKGGSIGAALSSQHFHERFISGRQSQITGSALDDQYKVLLAKDENLAAEQAAEGKR
jgi:hypothetical protein